MQRKCFWSIAFDDARRIYGDFNKNYRVSQWIWMERDLFLYNDRCGHQFRFAVAFAAMWFTEIQLICNWLRCSIRFTGECTKTTSHFLQEMQVPQIAQSDTVQEVEGTFSGPRQTSLRPKATRFRRSNEAHLQKEGKFIACYHHFSTMSRLICSFPFSHTGKDDKENRSSYGVYWVQVPQANSIEALQAFRIGRRQEAQGSNDPILNEFPFHSPWRPRILLINEFDFWFVKRPAKKNNNNNNKTNKIENLSLWKLIFEFSKIMCFLFSIFYSQNVRKVIRTLFAVQFTLFSLFTNGIHR